MAVIRTWHESMRLAEYWQTILGIEDWDIGYDVKHTYYQGKDEIYFSVLDHNGILVFSPDEYTQETLEISVLSLLLQLMDYTRTDSRGWKDEIKLSASDKSRKIAMQLIAIKNEIEQIFRKQIKEIMEASF